ncbi:MAG: 50S ribosomal protein L17 [Candidatus Marinimicrobia bacterium]|nr:50S ribosomal protein L17 [Candidatus Neomarinimicrobiota bacterium]
MRHRKDGRKLGRTASHRKAMLANMAANLFIHKQIQTTHPKALEARRLAETLITKAKKGDIHSRRMVLKVIPQKDVVKILFDEIAPQYAEREGGYTRIIKLGQRKNDAADVSLLTLVDFDPSGKVTKAESKKGKKKASTPVAKVTEAASAEEVSTELVNEVEVAADTVEEVSETSTQEEILDVTALEPEASDSETDSETEAEKS